jgi:hypothetical protein
VLDQNLADLAALAVALSMLVVPALFALAARFGRTQVSR